MQATFHKLMVKSDVNVNYLWIIVMFLPAVWTLILTAPIHFRWSIRKWRNSNILQICSDE